MTDGSRFAVADAHFHVWDPTAHYYPWLCDAQPIPFRYGDYSSLRRPYLVADYRADSSGWRVERGVYVEAEWDPRDPLGEMAFIGRIRARGFPTVAIAQAWLHHENCPSILDELAKHAFVRGVRHKPKPGMMDDARWRAGYARLAPLGLHFELQAPWGQLAEAERLARAFPETLIVLNHTGLPYDDQLPGWRGALSKFATCPNAAVKISGLGNVNRKRDAILSAIEYFGPQRAMFASNFPVDSLRGSFDAIYAEFDRCTQNLSDAERRGLFHDNAVRLYRMDPP